MLVLASIQLTVLLLLHQQPVEAGQLSQGITGLAMDMASNIGKIGCGHSLEFSTLQMKGNVRIQFKCPIWNLYFAELRERTLGSTPGRKLPGLRGYPRYWANLSKIQYTKCATPCRNALGIAQVNPCIPLVYLVYLWYTWGKWPENRLRLCTLRPNS
jgi:hypothetical protein